jgi:hypothetical protein
MKKKSVEMQPAQDRREGGNHLVPKRNNPALASCESVAVKRIFRGMNGPEPPKVDDHFVHSMNNMVPKKCKNAAMNGFKQQAGETPRRVSGRGQISAVAADRPSKVPAGHSITRKIRQNTGSESCARNAQDGCENLKECVHEKVVSPVTQ